MHLKYGVYCFTACGSEGEFHTKLFYNTGKDRIIYSPGHFTNEDTL